MKTLRDLTEDFYELYRAVNSSHHTIARLKTALRQFLGYLEDAHEITTADVLLPEHMHAFQKHLAHRLTKKGLPLKTSTINTVIKAARPFLEMLHDEGYLRRGLAKHLKYIKEPEILPQSVLQHAQVRKLLRKIDATTPEGIRDRAAIELMYSSGLRIGEVETLTLRDLDLEKGIARVVGKGRKERFVPIGKTALKWLSSYIRGVRSFLVNGHDTDAVFLNTKGRPLNQATLRCRVREYGRLLGLDIQITPHTFRRSCTSEMIKANANLYHVKQLLGHKRFDTLNHYAKLNIADLRKTHEKCHPREKDE